LDISVGSEARCKTWVQFFASLQNFGLVAFLPPRLQTRAMQHPSVIRNKMKESMVLHYCERVREAKTLGRTCMESCVLRPM